MSEYPEHDKAKARSDESDTLTAFYDWLHEDGIQLCRFGVREGKLRRCSSCRGTCIDTTNMTPRHRQLLEAGQLKEVADWPRCPSCEGTGEEWYEWVDPESLAPINETPDRLFARHFGIDYDAFMAEKQAIYERLRDGG